MSFWINQIGLWLLPQRIKFATENKIREPCCKYLRVYSQYSEYRQALGEKNYTKRISTRLLSLWLRSWFIGKLLLSCSQTFFVYWTNCLFLARASWISPSLERSQTDLHAMCCLSSKLLLSSLRLHCQFHCPCGTVWISISLPPNPTLSKCWLSILLLCSSLPHLKFNWTVNV